jgi:hypothetical protein
MIPGKRPPSYLCQLAKIIVRAIYLRQARLDILFNQIWKILQDLLRAHAGGRIGEYIIDRDSHTENTRFTTPFTGFDRDNMFVGCIHDVLQTEQRFIFLDDL